MVMDSNGIGRKDKSEEMERKGKKTISNYPISNAINDSDNVNGNSKVSFIFK